MLELYEPRQTCRHLHEFLCQIDSDDVAAVVCRKVARWSTDPAPDVEQAQPGTQLHLRSQLLRLLEPTQMKFVHCRQISHRKIRRIFPFLRHCLKDGLFKPPAGVMSHNFCFGTHCSNSGIEMAVV